MDFGAIIKAPTEDKDWIKKILLMGLMMLIPIAGPLNLLGYIKAVYEARKGGGTELPEANLSYIGPGFWVFVAFLPLVGAMILLVVIIVLAPTLLWRVSPTLARIVGLGGNIIYLVIMLGVAVVGPAIIYLHVAKGERWASIKVGAILELVKTDIGKYFTFWALFLVAGLIGGAGQIACGIGVIFTMPLCYAIQGVAIHEFEKLEG